MERPFTSRLRALALKLGCFVVPSVAFGAEGFVERFDAPLDRSEWELSEYAHPQGWIDARWDPDSVSVGPDGLSISLVPEETESGKRFVSGELRRRAKTGFGRYEVVMRAARGAGLNSAFFIYTGPHRGDPHDEVDFEFLGRAPTKVWLNYFADGDAKLGRLVDLGFDASAGLHHYAFEWDETSIRWYADGRLLHETSATDAPPPQTSSQIYLSLWAGSPDLSGWLGRADPGARAGAEVACVAFIPRGETGEGCAP
ncbi:MAG: family 16 glycosylhydrolase [Pseudomonadota bacterium]